MKRVIFMLLFLVVSVVSNSCSEVLDDVKDEVLDLFEDGEEILYVGTVDVTISGISTYSNNNSEVTLVKDGSVVSILMSDMKFSEYMPVSIDIEISDIPTDGGTFAIDEVVPTVSNIPMSDYTVTNVSGSYTSSILVLSFECYGSQVQFTGEVSGLFEDMFGDNAEVAYLGEMDVLFSGVTAYSNDEALFTLVKDGDQVSILMESMKFSEYMPVTLDIKISNIPTDGSTFSIDEVIPTVSDIPMSDYTITNVSGRYSTTTLSMTFECYGCEVEFVGTINN